MEQCDSDGVGSRRGATTATLLHVSWRMARSLRVEPGAKPETARRRSRLDAIERRTELRLR